MARAALDWTLTDLAQAAGVGVSTINRFEADQSKPTATTIDAIQRTLEEAGIIFLADRERTDGGAGVRLREQQAHEPEPPLITPDQCREARTLLGWPRDRLAERSGVPFASLGKFERGATPLHAEAHAAIRDALEAAGVEFIPENGGGRSMRLRDRRYPEAGVAT